VTFVCKYVALYVPDLRAAEDFYRRAFGVEVLFRESERDGQWWALPAACDWDDALAAGVEIDMVALRRDDFVLALFRGAPEPGTVLEVSIALDPADIERLRERPPDGLVILEHDQGFLRFTDPFGFRWVLQRPDAEFRSSGQIAGRWLDASSAQDQ
jgi:catechol 2,3-dioxygenase-like lactoylglutathione lyase family enzyme